MSAPRLIDYDECRTLHTQGWTHAALAERYGVTEGGVFRVLHLDRVRKYEKKARERYYAATCEDCGGPARVNWADPSPRAQRRLEEGIICRNCRGLRTREETLLRRMNDDGDIRCSKCKDYRPPNRYGDKRGFPRPICLDCEAQYRRELRERTRDRAA